MLIVIVKYQTTKYFKAHVGRTGYSLFTCVMMISIGLFVSHSGIIPPLEFAAVKFSSPANNAEGSSEIVTPSAKTVALLNVMLSALNVESLEKYQVVSMLPMEKHHLAP